MQIHPNIKSEYGRLRSVMVGIARKMGPKPAIEDCYDARSRESVELGTSTDISHPSDLISLGARLSRGKRGSSVVDRSFRWNPLQAHATKDLKVVS